MKTAVLMCCCTTPPSTWRLLCNSFMGNILKSLTRKQVISRKEPYRSLQVGTSKLCHRPPPWRLKLSCVRPKCKSGVCSSGLFRLVSRLQGPYHVGYMQVYTYIYIDICICVCIYYTCNRGPSWLDLWPQLRRARRLV